MIEWAKLVGSWIFSWPVAVVIVALIFKEQLEVWLDSVKKFKAGPVEIQRELKAVAEAGKNALDSVSQMIVLLGESRMTELQVTLNAVGAGFPARDQETMRKQIAEIDKLLKKIRNTPRQRVTGQS